MYSTLHLEQLFIIQKGQDLKGITDSIEEPRVATRAPRVKYPRASRPNLGPRARKTTSMILVGVSGLGCRCSRGRMSPKVFGELAGFVDGSKTRDATFSASKGWLPALRTYHATNQSVVVLLHLLLREFVTRIRRPLRPLCLPTSPQSLGITLLLFALFSINKPHLLH